MTLLNSFGSETKQKPNVLFIAVDDLNDWVGYLGGHPQAKTPNIDKLASEGAAFMNAYCSAPVCGPSRTSLMYGIYPHKSGSYGHHDAYSPQKVMTKDRLNLTNAFRKNDYKTIGYGKIFHYNHDLGFDEYQSRAKVNAKREKVVTVGNLAGSMYKTSNHSDTSDGGITDKAIEQLNKKHDKPFFLALGLRKPHLSWDAPQKYFDQYDLKTIKLPKVPEDDLDDLPDIAKTFATSIPGFKKINDHENVTAIEGAWQKLVYAYLATCSSTDSNVGRILEALNKSQYKDNTIVILWGDHGWHLGEKKHWRKMSLWERGTKVPFIIKVPRAKANGSKIKPAVSLQDIFPTLVDLCQLKVKQELDGNSLKPLLENPQLNWDKPALMSHGPGNFAIRQNQWRLIRYADGSEELYDLEKDPLEFKNLANDKAFDVTREKLGEFIPKTWKYIIGPRFQQSIECFSKPKK